MVRLSIRVKHAGAVGRDAYGDPAPGQRLVTVELTRKRARLKGNDTAVVTYPRFLVVRPCPAKS